jgi:hypothetical protein
MNCPNQLRTLAILLSTVVVTSCYNFYEMVVFVNGSDVAFTLQNEYLTDKGVKFMLYDIGVSVENCKKDCVQWEMVRPIDSNIDPVDENFVKLPIKYGVALPNMQTRVYKNLQKGNYRVSGTIVMIQDGHTSNTINVIGKFKIE